MHPPAPLTAVAPNSAQPDQDMGSPMEDLRSAPAVPVSPARQVLEQQHSQGTGASMEALALAEPISPELASPLEDQQGQGMGAPMEMQTLPLDVPAQLSPPKRRFPGQRYTMEMIFREFTWRRAALIRALTKDQKMFLQRCTPGTEPLGLYGHTDGKWELQPTKRLVRGTLPEPTLGSTK
ncbi:hypothetical protein ACP4OV_012407 [Aristida adscensionis]